MKPPSWTRATLIFTEFRNVSSQLLSYSEIMAMKRICAIISTVGNSQGCFTSAYSDESFLFVPLSCCLRIAYIQKASLALSRTMNLDNSK